jgi:hypothetical protein
MKTELAFTDADIQEFLRSPTALERSAKARPILKLLAKHGELPSRAIIKVFSDSNASSLSHPPMALLIKEGYVTERKGVFQGAINHFFKITPKERAALK